MGITHFISLGKSPGGATAALAYVKKRFDEKDTKFFAGSLGGIQNIVLFTTPEIKDGTEISYPYKDNQYGSNQGKKINSGNVIDVVTSFIEKEFGEILKKEKGKVYYCEASTSDLEKNLRNISKVVLSLSPSGKTGKNIWMNVTGGTNVMNISMLLASFLSGLISRTYYTFVPKEHNEMLRPVNEENFWIDIPSIKIGFDENYYEILKILGNEWLNQIELLNRLKGSNNYFNGVSEDVFKREFLNKMDSQGLIKRDGNKNKLSGAGEKILDLLEDSHMKSFVFRGKEYSLAEEPPEVIIEF